MKRNWQPEELIEHWTILPNESKLLTKKNATNRLAIALLLKFFELEGRFPTSFAEIPNVVISYVARSLKVPSERLESYDWKGRSIKRHRALIKDFLGIIDIRISDSLKIVNWLNNQVLPYDLKPDIIENAIKERFRYLKIEVPPPQNLKSWVRFVIRDFEDRLCQNTAERLSESTCHKLDAMFETSWDFDNPSSQNTQSPLAAIKSDPGRLGLDSVISEASKLQQLLELELPDNLFSGISNKVLQIYKQRVTVEPPRELRRHPNNRRYMMLAAFGCLRIKEITDRLVDLLIQIIHRIGARAERRVSKELLDDFKKVSGKTGILFQLAFICSIFSRWDN